MKLLITGGTGFVGSHLAREAVAAGAEVVLFDRYPSPARIGDIADRVTVVEGDVLEPQELLATMSRHEIDHVAHLGFIPGPALPEKFVPYLRVQCMGTANVFEAARIHGVKRVANASSVAVFGHGSILSRPVTEDDPTHPDDLYGTCKVWGEFVADYYNREHGMEILSLRITASFGFGRVNRASLASGVMGVRTNFLAAPELLSLGRPVTMPPDEQLFDLLYAADTGLAFWLALSRPRPPHSVFNLRGEPCRVGDLTALLRGAFPDGEITVSDSPPEMLQLMDNTRLVEELGFEVRFGLEAALDDYLRRIGGG